MMNTSLSYRAGDPFAEHLLTVLQDLAGASAKVLEAGAAGDDAEEGASAADAPAGRRMNFLGTWMGDNMMDSLVTHVDARATGCPSPNGDGHPRAG